MRVVVQVVTRAAVRVEGEIVGSIGPGLVLLVGLGKGDTAESIAPMAEKIANLRIFPNEAGKFDRSVLQTEGEILSISQFTLFADTSRGRRPEFSNALPAGEAAPLYENFLGQLRATGVKKVENGVFGAMMKVELENNGPVTIILEA